MLKLTLKTLQFSKTLKNVNSNSLEFTTNKKPSFLMVFYCLKITEIQFTTFDTITTFKTRIKKAVRRLLF